MKLLLPRSARKPAGLPQQLAEFYPQAHDDVERREARDCHAGDEMGAEPTGDGPGAARAAVGGDEQLCGRCGDGVGLEHPRRREGP